MVASISTPKPHFAATIRKAISYSLFLLVCGRSPVWTEDAQLQEARAYLMSLHQGGGRVADGAVISGLLTDLGHADYAVREKATLALVAAGLEVVVFLEGALESQDPEVAMRARRIRDEVQAQEAYHLDSYSINQLPKLARLLAQSGDAGVPGYLIPLLGHENQQIREKALATLHRLTRVPVDLSVEDTEQGRELRLKTWENWWEFNQQEWTYSPELESAVLISDPAARQVLAVDLNGDLLWKKSFDLPPMVAELTDRGHLFVGYREKGIVHEFSPAGELLWSFDGKEDVEGIFDLQLLDNGHLLLTDDPGNQVLEINREGDVVWKITELARPHAAWRTPDGHTHVAMHKESAIVSYDQKGKETGRMESLLAITDLRPYGDDGTWMVTRMGEKPQLLLYGPDGSETTLYSSGWPLTSGLLAPEGIVFTATREHGVIRGFPDTRLVHTGLSRNDMWGKLRMVSRKSVDVGDAK